MPRRGRIALIAMVVALGTAGLWGWGRYYDAILWPEKVQRETLGRKLVAFKEQISREKAFAYGQGFIRWQYRVANQNAAVQSVCGSVAIEHCTFMRTRQIESEVSLTVSLAKGVLTVEEWWS